LDDGTTMMTEEEFDLQHHRQMFAQRNFENVTFAQWQIKTWHVAQLVHALKVVLLKSCLGVGTSPRTLSWTPRPTTPRRRTGILMVTRQRAARPVLVLQLSRLRLLASRRPRLWALMHRAWRTRQGTAEAPPHGPPSARTGVHRTCGRADRRGRTRRTRRAPCGCATAVSST
jgi:hypothetical protein